MEFSPTVAAELQLDEYVEIAHQIYSENDRYRSIWDIWAHTLHHAAGIGESIRKSTPLDKLFDEIADCTLWLLTAIHRFSRKILEPSGQDDGPPETLIRIESCCSDLVWYRYPIVCHTCYLRRTEGNREKESEATFTPCDCSVHPARDSYTKNTKRRALTALREFSKENLGKKPKTIDQWQQMFGKIFSSNIDRLHLTDLALHLMEELGETSDAMIRMYSYKNKELDDNSIPTEPQYRQFRLEAQLADVFSRLFAIVEKTNRIASIDCDFRREIHQSSSSIPEPIRLSTILWRRYGRDDWKSFWCRFCGKPQCTCELVFIPANQSIQDLLRLLGHDR